MIILKRKLADGSEAKELDQPIALIIWTKVPEKWQITDLETGAIYIGDKDKHVVFGDILVDKVNKGNIGQWKKV